MKSEIAVTRRATYKAEEAVQKLEREKTQQDNLIAKLQESLKSLHQAATLRAAQARAFPLPACQTPWMLLGIARVLPHGIAARACPTEYTCGSGGGTDHTG